MGDHCLTKEQVMEAYRRELRGDSRTRTALRYHVSESTLERAYRSYGLPPPHRGKYKERKKQ